MEKGGSVSTSLLVLAVLLVSVLFGVGLVAAGAGEDVPGAGEDVPGAGEDVPSAGEDVPGSVGTAGVSDGTAAVSTVSNSVSDAVDPRPTPTATDDTDTIFVQNRLFLTEESGTVGVTTRAEIPDRVTELAITLHSATDATVDADGFEPAEDTDSDEEVWAWDGETESPSLTYVMDANDTVDGHGPIATGGTYRFVDAGDWALVQAPRLTASWSFTGQFSGQVRTERETVVDGEGAASRTMAFLGPSEAHVHDGVDGRYRLIVPEAAEMAESPGDVFAVFDDAATALRVGSTDDEVFAVAAPTGDVSWGVRGLQTGDADLWVRDEETLDTPDDVWTHEYVHTRQSYRAEPSARWFTEATATYYAALFALERGDADFVAFERTLARGERDPDAPSVLAEPETWAANADYTKGSLVAGEIDRRIRLATDGGASLATVFRSLNDADGPITNKDILDGVEAAAAAGGDEAVAVEVRAEAERLTGTRAAPETWDQAAHAAAFGETPARVGYALADEGVRASGEYRARPVDRDPVELIEGETLGLSMLVSNTGGAAGSYDLSLTVDGETVDERSGTVQPGGETIESLEHTFSDSGDHGVRIGSETLEVVVTEPASVLVREVAADPAAVAAGESVRVTATVANDAGIPAGSDVDFLVDGEVVGTETVRLDANAETTVERDVRIDGEVGADSVTVSVAGPVDDASATVEVDGEGIIAGTTDGAVPGFGPIAALVAVLTAGITLARRGRR
mgnify:CR=1 FL=1